MPTNTNGDIDTSQMLPARLANYGHIFPTDIIRTQLIDGQIHALEQSIRNGRQWVAQFAPMAKFNELDELKALNKRLDQLESIVLQDLKGGLDLEGGFADFVETLGEMHSDLKKTRGMMGERKEAYEEAGKPPKGKKRSRRRS